jgi:hypothetical protein
MSIFRFGERNATRLSGAPRRYPSEIAQFPGRAVSDDGRPQIIEHRAAPLLGGGVQSFVGRHVISSSMLRTFARGLECLFDHAEHGIQRFSPIVSSKQTSQQAALGENEQLPPV